MEQIKILTPRPLLCLSACIALILGLSGCKTLPKPVLLEGKLAALVSVPQPLEYSARWWEALGDPVLDNLVHQALDTNFTLEAARLRLQEARGLDKSSKWQLAPKTKLGDQWQGTHTLKYEEEGFPAFDYPSRLTHTVTESFQVSWEAPLFGKASAILAQGKAKAEQARWQLEGARLSVSADIVRTYAQWQGTCADIKAYDAELATYIDLKLLEERVKYKGASTQEDIDKIESQRLATLAQRTAAIGQRDQSATKISALMGNPGLVALPLGIQDCPLSSMPQAPKVEVIPANALRFRPDVHLAEAAVLLASAQAGAATASLYPQFSLGGSLVFNTGDLDTYGSIRGVANVANVTGGITIPLLDYFTLTAQAKASKVELKAAVVDYRQAVTVAWDETREAFEDYSSAVAQARILTQKRALAGAEVLRAKARADRGIGTLQEVLKARLSEDEEVRAVSDQQAISVADWAKLEKASFIVKAPSKP